MAAASPRAVVALTTPHFQRPFAASSKAPTPRLQSLYNTSVGFSTSTSQRPIPVLHPIKQKSVIDVQKRPHPIIIQLGAKRRGYLNIISSSRLVINCEISNSCSSSLYSMLGVEQNVAIPEIKRAYRNLALRFHPDVCPTADVTEVTQKFVQLQNAYSVLSVPEQRADYDYQLMTNSIATLETLGFDSNKSGLRMSKCSWSRSKDHLVRASWKSQWEAQIRKLGWGYASAEQESHRRTWGSRMRTEQNTPNHTTF